MKLWLKIAISTIVIGIIGVGIWFFVYAYELRNSCTFTFITSSPKSHDAGSRFMASSLSTGDTHDRFFPTLSCISIYVNESPVSNSSHVFFKPLILLYPPKNTDVSVHLAYAPGFFATFPEYSEQEKGWRVTAYPDGNLMDKASGQETYGLFWEGNPGSDHFDMSHGSVIKGSEIRDFLYTKLTEIGLNTKEKSDFIMFWYPKLQNYPYVQVTFVGNEYSETAKLDISPKPDSLLRVFMAAKPLSEYKKIPEQVFETFQRKGFSVVEWGGTIIE